MRRITVEGIGPNDPVTLTGRQLETMLHVVAVWWKEMASSVNVEGDTDTIRVLIADGTVRVVSETQRMRYWDRLVTKEG